MQIRVEDRDVDCETGVIRIHRWKEDFDGMIIGMMFCILLYHLTDHVFILDVRCLKKMYFETPSIF